MPDKRKTKSQLLEEVATLRKRVAALEAEAKYRNFVEQSTEGIWRIEFDAPIPTDLPAEEQVQRIQQTSFLAECNLSLARMYGYSSSQGVY